jgi:hypothetical protein
MKMTIPIVSPYESIVPYIRAEHLERVLAVSEAIGTFIARWWREISAPPRPAFIIVAVRERRFGNKVSLLFAPR